MISSAPKMTYETDFLVIGAGVAGLTLAQGLAQNGRVILLCKGEQHDNNTWFAQGGIASAIGIDDSVESHIEDTIRVGAGLCKPEIVRDIIEEGPQAIRRLVELGVNFSLDEDKKNEFHLTVEGGHTHRRVLHHKDATGREMITKLWSVVSQNPNIEILTGHMAVDLLTTDKIAPDFGHNRCLGAYILEGQTGAVKVIQAHKTFLCTGGHGKLYLYTSNPDSATGDGLAMASRAGCRVANLEFMQFHPTGLFSSKVKNFLITEALRGEGGILYDHLGKRFMPLYHPRGELAPRDIVARAIDSELKKSGHTHVFLDVRHLGPEKVRSHFPNIYDVCLSVGIDITKDMIPVVPAAHYSCGGIVVDSEGQSDVENLYAIGEVACTGLHGANRLASNSLLEAVVMGQKVSRLVGAGWPKDAKREKMVEIPSWNAGTTVAPDELVVLSHTWDEIRRLMWHYVGIVRSDKRLKRAEMRIESILRELNEFYWNYQITEQFLEVRNLAIVAKLTIRCAMARKESRGIHYTIDYPQEAALIRDTIIR